jgi:hypothetical protein
MIMKKANSDKFRRIAIQNATYKHYVLKNTLPTKSLCLQKIKELREQIRILRNELDERSQSSIELHKENVLLLKRLAEMVQYYSGIMRQNEVLIAMTRKNSYEGGLGW